VKTRDASIAISLLSILATAGTPAIAHAQPTESKKRTGQAPGCVPGQQIACACIGGGSGVQRCSEDGASFGACQGCVGQPEVVVTECNPAGTLHLQLYWQTKKCSWAMDKATFVVSRSLRGHSILDKSDGVPEKATVRAERRSTGCAIEIVQTIDPEGAVAGSKSVSIARYAYHLTETNGLITGDGTCQIFEFDDAPACTASFAVVGTRSVRTARR